MVLLIIILLAAFYLKNTGLPQSPTFINNPSPSPLLLPKEAPSENNVKCPADVKQCSDGSYVGRVAPSCSFAPCPKERKYQLIK